MTTVKQIYTVSTVIVYGEEKDVFRAGNPKMKGMDYAPGEGVYITDAKDRVILVPLQNIRYVELCEEQPAKKGK